MSFLKKYEKFYHWVVHPDIKTDLRKDHYARQGIFNMCLAAYVMFLYFVLSVYMESSLWILFILTDLVLVVSLYVITRTSNLDLGTHIALSAAFLCSLVLMYFTGGFFSIISIILIYFPWVGFLYKYKIGVIWTIIPAIALSIFIFLHFNNYSFPNIVPSAYREGFVVITAFLFSFFYIVVYWFDNQNKQRLFEKLEDGQKLILEKEKMASLGQLTAGIAHEINNPLNFITSNIEALQLDIDDIVNLQKQLVQLKISESQPREVNELIQLAKSSDINYSINEIKNLLRDMEYGGSRIKDIVSSLQIYSHQSDDNVAVQEDINLIVKAAGRILNNKIKQKEISINLNLGDLPKIRCHAGKIHQVFVNILDNAIGAVSQNGHIEIQSQIENDHIKIVVRDDGKGIAEEHLKKIFDPFFTTKSIGDGTGLGLYISYTLIKEHGGEINLESKVGEGTNVAVLLPIA